MIDDERVFADPLVSDEVVYCKTSKEGIAALEEDWDVIYLDHDLGGTDTIMPVIDKLQELAYLHDRWPAPQIIIHSANNSRNQFMRITLEHYYYKAVVVKALDVGLVKLED